MVIMFFGFFTGVFADIPATTDPLLRVAIEMLRGDYEGTIT